MGLHEDVAKTIRWLTSLAQIYTGQWPAAAGLLAEVCASTQGAGALGLLWTYAAMHAHALLHLGQLELARGQLELSMRIGVDDDVVNPGLVHGAQAWLAALDGDRTACKHHGAVATVALPERELPTRALIHEACAEAAIVLGEHSVAQQHRQQALALHRAKGNAVSVARLQEAI